MKSVQTLAKNHLKYVPILLGMIVCIAIFYNTINDNPDIHEESIKSFENNSNDNTTCPKNFQTIISAVFKWSLAFLISGLVSDRKFIFFGTI